MKFLWNHVDFAFQKNDHTAAELLLWPNGFQQYTPTPDDELFEAYAGDDVNSAIADKVFNDGDRGVGDHRQPLRPGHRRRALHHQRRPDRRRLQGGHPAYTPEGSEPNIPNVSGFEFQDVEADIEAGVPAPPAVRARPARSPPDGPGEPDLAHGQHGPELLRRDLQGLLRRPAARRGRGQEVAGRRQAALPHQRRRGEDGRTRRKFMGGERFGEEPGLYYHRLRGTVTGTNPGDEVEVWFEGGRRAPRTSPTRPARRPATRC